MPHELPSSNEQGLGDRVRGHLARRNTGQGRAEFKMSVLTQILLGANVSWEMSLRIGRWRTLVVVLATASLSGCEGTDRPDQAAFEPAVALDTTAVRIETETDTFSLSAEFAETEEKRRYGLMERPSLPEDHGMLFVYSEPQDSASGFWMYRTEIPLDIAYLDAEGRIVAIRSMEPCESPYTQSCPTYPAGAPYSAALEVNRGYFERRGITTGDRVVRIGADDVDRR